MEEIVVICINRGDYYDTFISLSLCWKIILECGVNAITLSGVWTFSQKATVSLFSIRSNFHRMLKQWLCWREKPRKSKVSADLGQKWMCVSVSAEWVWGNWFTPGIRFSELSVYILAKGILFRKREGRWRYEKKKRRV